MRSFKPLFERKSARPAATCRRVPSASYHGRIAFLLDALDETREARFRVVQVTEHVLRELHRDAHGRLNNTRQRVRRGVNAQDGSSSGYARFAHRSTRCAGSSESYRRSTGFLKINRQKLGQRATVLDQIWPLSVTTTLPRPPGWILLALLQPTYAAFNAAWSCEDLKRRRRWCGRAMGIVAAADREQDSGRRLESDRSRGWT